MLFFVKNFSIFILILELTPIFSIFYDNEVTINNIYIYIFLVCIYLNFSLNDIIPKNMDLDLIVKFLVLFFRTPSFLINYIILLFKKIYLYLIHFKYKHDIKTINLFHKYYLTNFFTIWRPLFKKTSYFGYFRSNRSKWIK